MELCAGGLYNHFMGSLVSLFACVSPAAPLLFLTSLVLPPCLILLKTHSQSLFHLIFRPHLFSFFLTNAISRP